ncbi:hypothetical protein ISCGN_004040 [Ixodes scapularis]
MLAKAFQSGSNLSSTKRRFHRSLFRVDVDLWSGGALEETDRVRVLPSGTLRIESAEQPDSANYSCHAHNVYGRDSVHYAVHVHMNTSQTSPQRPASVSVLSTSPSSITLGWLKRNFSGGVSMPPVREYELHYKRQQGSWDLVRVAPPASVLGGSAPARSSVATVSASWSNGTRLTHELTGLFCGTQYHIYLVAVGDKGKSDPSDTVFARTQGGVPPSPKQDAFVSPNASSLTLRPGAWSGAGCPVSHLAVEYRLRDGTGPWLVASRALQPREGPMTLHHLRPDTWYSVRVTAHSEAGPAVAEYAVRTLPASAMLAAPQRPASVSVLSTSPSSITLGWLKRNFSGGVSMPPVRGYGKPRDSTFSGRGGCQEQTGRKQRQGTGRGASGVGSEGRGCGEREAEGMDIAPPSDSWLRQKRYGKMPREPRHVAGRFFAMAEQGRRSFPEEEEKEYIGRKKCRGGSWGRRRSRNVEEGA